MGPDCGNARTAQSMEAVFLKSSLGSYILVDCVARDVAGNGSVEGRVKVRYRARIRQSFYAGFDDRQSSAVVSVKNA